MTRTRMYGSGTPGPPDEPVLKAFPDGHFYSPIPDLHEVARRDAEVFAAPDELPGIDLGIARQLELLPLLARASADAAFPARRQPGHRYYKDNNFFGAGDAIVWYGMLRRLRPQRVVEVGSGFSSAVLLDAVDRTADWDPRLTFVEPYPERLLELVAEHDRIDLVQAPVQEAPRTSFEALRAGDVLFIDSTHVGKIGSDVLALLLDVIPRLPPGVFVHLHDIFYPFQYPPEWVYQGFAWNEAYLLRALLTGNERLRIAWWNNLMATFHHDEVAAAMPVWAENTGGSIYLRTG